MRSSRRSNPISNIFILIALGIFGGIVYLVFTGLGGDSDPEPTPVAQVDDATPTVTATLAPDQPTFTPQPTPTLAAGLYELSSARINIPEAAINAPIVQVYLEDGSWDVANLGMNVGHLQGTTWLSGVPGNIVLSGHVEMRDGRQGVFAGLDELQIGSLIILEQGNQEILYAVTEIMEVEPTNLDPVRPTTSERLTLITCDDYDFFADEYQIRTVVVAEPFGA